MKKLLHRFEHPWQAELFQGVLSQDGIKSFKMEGAREYATIVTGIGQPVSEVFVDEAEFEGAQKILANYLSKPYLHVVEDPAAEPQKKPDNSFRKILFFSAAGAVFLPVVLNIFAVIHLVKFLKLEEETLFRKFIAVAVVVAGWSGSISLIYLTTTHFIK